MRSNQSWSKKFSYLEACINAGVNFIVTAEMYGGGVSELIPGENLKIGKWDRDELIIPKKLFPGARGIRGNSRKRMRVGVKSSLKRLQFDNIDLPFLHCIDASLK